MHKINNFKIQCVLLILTISWCKCVASSGGAVDLEYSCVRHVTSGKNLAPIILLHGVLADRNNWHGIHQVLAMQTDRKVCMADARNHGLSPWSEEFNFDVMSEDTIRLMDRLNISKAVLLGHSMGGRTAVVTALNHPDRVEKLIVEDMRPNSINPAALYRLNATFQTLLQSLDAVPEGANPNQAKEAVVQFVNKRFFELLGFNITHRMANLLRGLLDCTPGKCRYKVNIELASKALMDPAMLNVKYDGLYTGEALFVYGKQSDFKVEEDEENIKKLFPKAQLVGIDDAKHSVHEDQPREFLSVVIKFLKSN